MYGAETEKKPKLRVILFPLIAAVAAAATMAGVYAYHRFVESEMPQRTAIEVASTDSARPSAGAFPAQDSGGFSFSTYDEPRPLPRVPFTDGDWRELTLDEFRGKVVLLNIWATWCGPCREEMPTLDRLQAKLGGPDFQVVALSIDQEGIFAVKKFYEELGLETLDIYVDESMRAPSLLGVIGVPATLLIDGEGREVGRKLGPAEWDSAEVVAEIRRHLEGSLP